jgi:hypothetical protein
MIKRTVLILVLSLSICNFAAFAQAPVCNDSMIMATKGKWKTPSDSLRPPRELVTNEQYRQVTNRIDAVHPLLLEAYPDLPGMEARWMRDGPMPSRYDAGMIKYEYSYRATLYNYFCALDARPGSPAALEGAPFKPILNGETATYFIVNFNGGFLSENINPKFTVNGRRVFLLERPTETWNGYDVYRTPAEDGKPVHGKVLLTRKGMLPYRPITRKQYLDYMIETVHRQFDDTIAACKKTLQMPEDPLGLKEGARQALADATAGRESISARFQEELQENEADRTLDSPAIVDGIEKIGFVESPNVFTTAEKGGQALVTVNPDYFRKDLPPYVPQVIVVHWIWEEQSAAKKYYGKKVEANLPIEKFQAMIDK